MTWLSAVSRWLFPSSNGAAESSDSAAIRRNLQRDQLEIAQEIERLFTAYDERLQGLALRLSDMDDEALEREISMIQEAQRGLRIALRRSEACIKAEKDLERELTDWEARKDEQPFHADHPRIRAEIVRSELLVRRLPIEMEQRAAAASRIQEAIQAPSLTLRSEKRISPEQLVSIIQEATREAERWHGLPSSEHDEDTLLQLHHVRDLHARLKELDREQGIERDRIELAVPVREYR